MASAPSSGYADAQAGPHSGDAKDPNISVPGDSSIPSDPPIQGPRSGGRRTRTIGPLRRGDLTSLGYSVTAKTKTRRAAIHRAIKKYGKTSTLRKLNAVAVYTRRTRPALSRIYKADVRYVQTK